MVNLQKKNRTVTFTMRIFCIVSSAVQHMEMYKVKFPKGFFWVQSHNLTLISFDLI